MTANANAQKAAIAVCTVDDLVPGSGVAVLVGETQIALFLLPDQDAGPGRVYAIGNYDPIGKANVLSRGIVGDRKGVPVVASPLYKQHFALETGACLEEPEVCVPAYPASVENGTVLLQI